MSDTPALHLRAGRVLDPERGRDEEADVVIEAGRIARIGKGLHPPHGARSVDCRGLLVVPGLVDLHVHLREPGEEYKEDIDTGTAAAAAGGFTAICCMPNTKPVNDSRAVTELIVRRAREIDRVRVFPVGAISQGLKGELLADMAEMKDAGIVAVSDDGRPVMHSGLMRRAMEYARTFGLPVVQHAEDLGLTHGTCMNEGDAATRAGLMGQPPQAEHVIVARDIALVELTGARYHVAHVSTAAALDEVRRAKARGLPVTCEVTPHHFTLTDEACLGYDTATKVNPPLRAKSDREALREGLADGTIDAIASDHAPHSSVEKDLEFDRAAFGMIGLETALPLALGLVREGIISLPELVRRMTSGPARVFGLDCGRLAEGAPADVTVIDLERKFHVTPSALKSKSRNTPFADWDLAGVATLTVAGGKIVHSL